MRKILETGIMIAAAYGFFGFIYPELCLIEDTCRIVIEQESTLSAGDGWNEEAIYNSNPQDSGERDTIPPGNNKKNNNTRKNGISNANLQDNGKKDFIPQDGSKADINAADNPKGDTDTKHIDEEYTNAKNNEKKDVDMLREISNLPPERIRIKSRLLEYLYEKE